MHEFNFYAHHSIQMHFTHVDDFYLLSTEATDFNTITRTPMFKADCSVINLVSRDDKAFSYELDDCDGIDRHIRYEKKRKK